MLQKRAQGGVNAAILVAIIAGLIILYIIFLPTSQREALLQNKTAESESGEDNPNVLLDVSPGSLSNNQGLENQKSIPDAFLVETTNAQELKAVNPFIVRNGWFDTKTYKTDFGIDDPANTDNVILSFTAKKHTGVITIKLNSVVIYENEIGNENIEPVKLDKRTLSKTNTLEFSVSSVGIRFWSTNEYSFENVKIIGDITDTSRQQSTNIFTITDSEFASMDKAALKFVPSCGSVSNVGILDIFVNNKKLFSSVPKCDDLYKQSIPKSVLNEGENNIVFKTNKGSYSVEQIKISLEFGQPTVRTYYFEINQDVFDRIRNGDSDLQLAVKFVDDGKQKRARLDVNGHIETIDTSKLTFTEKINTKISEGNNYIRLDPIDDVSIVELKIELV
ncbi:MAG TPA: hypothetical protein VJJ52_03120 [Candidatus Nanoarchaeia archaeon]|nr:hypothetical protein [Candidatus Nanoarchaeia archaeon]